MRVFVDQDVEVDRAALVRSNIATLLVTAAAAVAFAIGLLGTLFVVYPWLSMWPTIR